MRFAENEIEKSTARYILSNYGDAKKAVEIGFGGKTVVADILRESGMSVVCTDVKRYDLCDFSVVDDCFGPDLSIYEGADLIYSVRPGCEIVAPMIDIARAVDCDLLVYHLGFELYENGGEKIDAGSVVLHRYNRRSFSQ